MRRSLVVVHRWLGLFMAVFLFISGFTGAFISFDHELDSLLNPQFYHAPERDGPLLTALQLADQIEARDPRVEVGYMPVVVERGKAHLVSVNARIDPKTHDHYEVGYNQLALDPVTGAELGRREWGAISLARENVLPFLYRLHYSMHLPEVGGIETGILFMGIVAIVWTLDCFIALYLSFPNLASWRKSFAFRLRDGGYKLNFDLHRSGGVWTWLMLLTLAVTAVSMNLGRQVVRPIVSVFSELSPSPFDVRDPIPHDKQQPPRIDRARALEIGLAEAARRKLDHPVGGLFFSPDFNAYGVGFFEAGNEHGDGGLGNDWLYIDPDQQKVVGVDLPGTGSAGDIFLQAQFPLHSGRIFGLFGRVLVSLLGAVVATLSVTGVVIWARKRRARVQSQQRKKRASSELFTPSQAE